MTITVPIRRPRFIAPELVEIGDDVEVEIVKANRGIKTKKRGIVGKRVYSGKARFYTTEEGATIFSFEPGKPTGIKIMLYGRAEHVEESLFDMGNDEIRERIAG